MYELCTKRKKTVFSGNQPVSGHILQPARKRRLWEAKERQTGMSLEEVRKNLGI
jgi:hypothetical protein